MRAMNANETDRRLEEAARRSPEVAAMLAGKHDDPGPSYRRVVMILGATVIGVAALWFISTRLRPARAPHEAATEIDRSEYLLPLKTEKTAAGEETSPFNGFALSVESEPPGAVVSVAGKVRGEAPVLASVDCRAPEKIEIRAEKPGFRPSRRQVACRADTLVKLTLQLER
jgi:hypothetical protein